MTWSPACQHPVVVLVRVAGTDSPDSTFSPAYPGFWPREMRSAGASGVPPLEGAGASGWTGVMSSSRVQAVGSMRVRLRVASARVNVVGMNFLLGYEFNGYADDADKANVLLSSSLLPSFEGDAPEGDGVAVRGATTIMALYLEFYEWTVLRGAIGGIAVLFQGGI